MNFLYTPRAGAPRSSRVPRFGFAACTLCLSLPANAQSPAPSRLVEPATALQPNKPVERDLSAKQIRAFTILADSGWLLRIASTQIGIDIVVSILGPDGAKLAEVDSSDEGPEKEALAVARRSGQQRIEVRAFDTTAGPGRF